ncbi:dynein intermediate chain [Acrasis kona]|uniref:Dynein intermediate chain n=1 Tax=Acrasis kona TaxID=1008807 RepID=A0AAW2YWB1_9EUKA
MDIYNIEHIYKKQRRRFGRHYEFEDTDIITLTDIKPNDMLNSLYIERTPIHRGVQITKEKSEHEVNTETRQYHSQGMLHLEGGWPKDVNINDIDFKKRYQKKVENDEKYHRVLQNLAEPMVHNLAQNNSLDVYEAYFPPSEKYNQYANVMWRTGTSSATVLTVFKDPCCKYKRTASSISWYPSDYKKIAVAYCTPQSQDVPEGMDMDSFIWDVNNPNTPEMQLLPTSPLCCLEYNPKDTSCIVAGAYNGTLFYFDTRRGSQSVDYSHMDKSHNDPVYDVQWIQSKQGTEFASISTDGLLLIWDVRNLGEPIERNVLDTKGSKHLPEGTLGLISLDYNTQYSTSKFLIGTEQGVISSWNRKSKKKDKIERSYHGHHGTIYSVQRNPFLTRFFLSIGDWTARVWMDEIWKQPLIETRYNDSYLTGGCWSPSRPGVFFTTRMDGTLDVWDFLHNHNKPLVSVGLSDTGLYSIRPSNGKYLAVGDALGNVSFVELSDDLCNFMNGEGQSSSEEKDAIMKMFEREMKREKVLEAQKKKEDVEAPTSISVNDAFFETTVVDNEYMYESEAADLLRPPTVTSRPSSASRSGTISRPQSASSRASSSVSLYVSRIDQNVEIQDDVDEEELKRITQEFFEEINGQDEIKV